MQIVALAEQNEAVCIVIGQALHDDGEMSIQGRKSERLAAELKLLTSIPIVLWDESGSTQAARNIRREMQVPRRKRSGHLDSLAAAILLQDYLDSNRIEQKGNDEGN